MRKLDQKVDNLTIRKTQHLSSFLDMSSNTSDSLQYWLGLQQDVNYATQLHPGHKTICILWLIAALSPITALLYIISLVKRHRTGRLWQSRTFREGYLSPQAAFTIPALQVACSTGGSFNAMREGGGQAQIYRFPSSGTVSHVHSEFLLAIFLAARLQDEAMQRPLGGPAHYSDM